MIRNQFESAGLRVPSMWSATSSMRPCIAWPQYSIMLVLLLFTLLPTVAAQEPQRDPAGTATGDKQQAVDAGGNSFVVAEPTDKTAPDYAARKKAYDEYQAQAVREPLATKLADSVDTYESVLTFHGRSSPDTW